MIITKKIIKDTIIKQTVTTLCSCNYSKEHFEFYSLPR